MVKQFSWGYSSPLPPWGTSFNGYHSISFVNYESRLLLSWKKDESFRLPIANVPKKAETSKLK